MTNLTNWEVFNITSGRFFYILYPGHKNPDLFPPHWEMYAFLTKVFEIVERHIIQFKIRSLRVSEE